MRYGLLTPAEQALLGPGAAIPTVGMGGLVPNARILAAYIIATYPGVQTIGGVRADALPDHPSGHAIDIMIGSDMTLGDAINADVQVTGGPVRRQVHDVAGGQPLQPRSRHGQLSRQSR